MADRALLASIDIGCGAGFEEERGHVPGEKGTSLRIHHVEAIVIDQHRLLLEPVAPALRADFFYYARSYGTRKGGLHKSRARLPAPRAGYALRHARAYLRA